MEDKIYSVLEKYGIDEPKASAITEDLLFLCAVVKSLPSKEECSLFLDERIKQVSEECGESYLKRTLLFGFDRGFKEAFNWFKTR